jgi:hypothetical protein
LSKRPPDVQAHENHARSTEADTVIRTPKQGANLELHVTKTNLKRDLLSDKTAEEGGYDSDAEVLDDIAKKVGKKSPSERPSLHSIDWTPSSGRSVTVV